MKSLLISIQPKWCELIASGEKTVEVRKTKPKLKTPFKCYIYCTKGDWLTSVNGKVQKSNNMVIDLTVDNKIQELNGKVIGEFVCDRVYNIPFIIPFDSDDILHPMFYGFNSMACLADYEIDNYLGKNDGYGWHISDLVIYDKPKELSEFSKYGFGHPVWLKRPPQSWCYVEEVSNNG
jgi:predicted transcriptional regulator